jgi:hypothetical protein
MKLMLDSGTQLMAGCLKAGNKSLGGKEGKASQ